MNVCKHQNFKKTSKNIYRTVGDCHLYALKLINYHPCRMYNPIRILWWYRLNGAFGEPLGLFGIVFQLFFFFFYRNNENMFGYVIFKTVLKEPFFFRKKKCFCCKKLCFKKISYWNRNKKIKRNKTNGPSVWAFHNHHCMLCIVVSFDCHIMYNSSPTYVYLIAEF